MIDSTVLEKIRICQRRAKISRLARETELARSTIYALLSGKLTSIRPETLQRINESCEQIIEET